MIFQIKGITIFFFFFVSDICPVAGHKWLNIAGRKSGDFESALLESIGIWEANFGIREKVYLFVHKT